MEETAGSVYISPTVASAPGPDHLILEGPKIDLEWTRNGPGLDLDLDLSLTINQNFEFN